MFNPNRRFVQRAPGISECQRILTVAKSDVARIHSDLKMNRKPSNTDNTLYRYYCEALWAFNHMQHPGAVEARFTLSVFYMHFIVAFFHSSVLVGFNVCCL